MAKQTFTTGQVLTAAQMTSLQQTAMGGGSATAKTASYTLVAADAGATVIMNSASATTITVNTSLFSAGDTVFLQNIGAGVSTITAGTATVNTASSLALAQYESGNLYFTAAGASIFSKADGAGGGGAAGLTLIDEISFTASATTNFDNIFSSTYKNYRLHFVAKNVADNQLIGATMKMRASGTSTSAGYESQEIYGEATTIATRANLAGTDEWYGLSASGNNRGNNGFSIDLFSPNLSSYTAFNAMGVAQIEASGRPFLGLYGGVLTDTTAYDGISLICSVNLTGTLFVYGYAKE